MTNYSKWMQENLGTIGDRKLRDIIMPGSHDSGMYRTTNNTVGAGDGNAKTQSDRFSGQLAAGTRYFDIRPRWLGKSDFTTFHGDMVDVIGEQGCEGGTIDEILGDVDTFATNNKELILLVFSHFSTSVTEVASREVDVVLDIPFLGWFVRQVLKTLESFNIITKPPFPYGDFYSKVARKLGPHLLPNAPTGRLCDMTLREIIKDRSVVLPLFADSKLNKTALPTFFTYAAFDNSHTSLPSADFTIFDDYSNADNLGTVADRQFEYMRKAANREGDMTLLSWTATHQGVLTQFGSTIGTSHTLIEVANVLNPMLRQKLTEEINKKGGLWPPNILYTDNVATGTVDVALWLMQGKTVYSRDGQRSVSFEKFELKAGESLAPGERIFSPFQEYFLTYGTDGNAALYNNKSGTPVKIDTPYFGTNRETKADHVILTTKGSLEIRPDKTAASWTSSTNALNASLFVSDDGYVGLRDGDGNVIRTYPYDAIKKIAVTPRQVLKAGEVLAPNQRIESQDHASRLVYQSDGNLALCASSGPAIWSPPSLAGTPIYRTMLTAGGDLQVWSTMETKIWNFDTATPNVSLTVDDATYVVFRDPAGNAVRTIPDFYQKTKPSDLLTMTVTQPNNAATMIAGNRLYSPSSNYYLTLRSNGVLELYKKGETIPAWESALGMTSPGNPVASLTWSDKKFAVYDKAGGRLLWDSVSYLPALHQTVAVGGSTKQSANSTVLCVTDEGYVELRERGATADVQVLGRFPCDALRVGERMAAGNRLLSRNGKYALTYWASGRLTLAKSDETDEKNGQTMAPPDGSNKDGYAAFENNGVLSTHRKVGESFEQSWTSSYTDKNAHSLCVTDEGTIIIRDASGNPLRRLPDLAPDGMLGRMARGTKLWAGQRLYSELRNTYLTLQFDGNIVLYDATPSLVGPDPVWSPKNGNWVACRQKGAYLWIGDELTGHFGISVIAEDGRSAKAELWSANFSTFDGQTGLSVGYVTNSIPAFIVTDGRGTKLIMEAPSARA